MSSLAPILVAFIRAIMGAAFAAFTVYTTLSIEGSADDKAMVWTSIAAALSYIATRGGIEGIFDQNTKPDMNHPPATDVDNLPDPPKE